MRSITLIPKRFTCLSDWQSCLNGTFEIVKLEHSEGLARREGQPHGAPNKLLIEDGAEHLFVLERPTTRREYSEDELRAIQGFSVDARQFFAVDFTEVGLLNRVLRVLLQHEGRQAILVEDDESAFVLLENIPGVGGDASHHS